VQVPPLQGLGASENVASLHVHVASLQGRGWALSPHPVLELGLTLPRLKTPSQGAHKVPYIYTVSITESRCNPNPFLHADGITLRPS